MFKFLDFYKKKINFYYFMHLNSFSDHARSYLFINMLGQTQIYDCVIGKARMDILQNRLRLFTKN